ncbi:MAG: 3-isopropylmalate dehydratase large subunit [Desulfobacteraceae bacterium]
MTLAEKILSRASQRDRVKAGQFVTGKIDVAMVHEGMAFVLKVLKESGIERLWDSERVVCMLDHYVPAPTTRAAEMHKGIREAVKRLGIENFYGENAGICHQVMVERGHVLPGNLIVASDSHATTYGALGAGGTGVGFTEMAYVLAKGESWFRVPETIRFELNGTLAPMVMSKDIILFIAGKYTTEVAQYKSIEFVGSAVDSMSISSRMTMSNMSVELGAKFGFFEPDEKAIDYLRGKTHSSFEALNADKDAEYEATYRVDVSELEPQIALPYSVDNVKPISELAEIPIHQAVLGSCTNGRLEDLKIAAKLLKGRTVHPDVRLLVVPASSGIYREAINEGLVQIFLDANAIILNPSCGPCFGAHMGLLASGETCIASINRNFKGRMGSGDAKVYLASPATVGASAVEGRIADPRKYE